MGRAQKERSRHPLRENLEVAVFAVVMAMGLKVFAVEAYQIPTGSMQPTLMGTTLIDEVTRLPDGGLHDRVLVDKVSYWFRDPRRWEVVVFRYPLVTHVNYVKRLVGLPEEELLIENGDLFARPLGGDGDFAILRKPWKVQEHMWKRVLPPVQGDPERWLGWTESGALQRGRDGEILMQGRALLRYDHRIKDDPQHGYPDAIARRVPTLNAQARHVVGDLRIAFEAVPQEEGGALEVEMEFGERRCQLTLGLDGSVRVSGPEGFAHEAMLPSAPGRPLRVDAAFWDHTLRIELRGGGERLLIEERMELESRPAVRTGFGFSTRTGGWSLHPASVWRDVHYLGPRQTGEPPLYAIPEGHYFMLGDNTQSSLDSRDWQAEVIEFDPPARGVERVRGDRMSSGQDPQYDNPRWDRTREVMTFRDQHGGIHHFSEEQLRASHSRIEAAPLVPRDYVLGRAVAVFLPLRPFAPVNRIGLVH